VGTNSSGKSTLLQIPTRTIVPIDGSMAVRGRVLPMLSVGAGFHIELTGRENIVLQGAILDIPRGPWSSASTRSSSSRSWSAMPTRR